MKTIKVDDSVIRQDLAGRYHNINGQVGETNFTGKVYADGSMIILYGDELVYVAHWASCTFHDNFMKMTEKEFDRYLKTGLEMEDRECD